MTLTTSVVVVYETLCKAFHFVRVFKKKLQPVAKLAGSFLEARKFIAYYRVSTERQGRSGLGLEAQQLSVRNYMSGGNWELIEELVEVESGKRLDRPQIAEALRLCRLHGATLLIAKLDRLARNVAFVSHLMESGVDFLAVDFPTANRLTVHILAAVAEHEALAISDRTKTALAAAKARGVKLGGDRGNLPGVALEGSRKSAEIRGRNADARAMDLAPILRNLQGMGMSLRGIAKELGRRRIPTTRGGLWSAVAVSRVLERIG